VEQIRLESIHAQIATRAYERWEMRGALSAPRGKTGFVQKKSYGSSWTCRGLHFRRCQWKLRQAEI